MEKIKTIFSRAFPDKILSKDDITKLHGVLLQMLRDIDYACRKEGLTYMLSGGTCLGAIRHKGFIPWDDDADLMMPKADFLMMPEIIEKVFPGKYTVALPHSSVYDPTTCMKIYLNGTELVELSSEKWKKKQAIFVDVFSIEDVPDSAFSRRFKGFFFDVATHCSVLKAEYKYPSDAVKEKSQSNNELKRYYKKRRALGFIANLLPMKFWYAIGDRQISYKNKNSIYCAIPSGISYNREVLERGVYEEVIEADFENEKFFVPKAWNEYLSNLYGDFMKIPDAQNREVHTALKIDFGENK